MFYFKITSSEKLSTLMQSKGIHDSDALIRFIHQIPYGRTKNRTDLSLIITENKGTCSSKHAFIKAIATENNFHELKLIIGIYKMTAINTPNIGKGIEVNNLPYLPEAHCYLKIGEKTIDITSENSNFDLIQSSILEEIEIVPTQIAAFKVDYHKSYIQNWIMTHEIPLSFQTIWTIRENCIANLSIHSNQ